MAALRIAVAGAGLIGRRHIALIAGHPDCRRAAIVDRAPAAADTARHAGVPLFPALQPMFASLPLDGVVLATPNDLHVPQALECIAARVPP